MTTNSIRADKFYSPQRKRIVSEVAEQIRRSVAPDQADQGARFVSVLFDRTDVDDLEEYDLDALGAIAKSIWQLTAQRQRGEIVVRVYNPEEEEDVLTTPNTVIQIASDDMPFIIDSVMGELNEGGYQVLRILHPMIETQRDATGRRLDVHEVMETELGSWAESYAREKGFVRESIMHVEIDRQNRPETLNIIRENLESIMREVALVVGDWADMDKAVGQVAKDFQRYMPPTIDREDMREAVAFLEWLVEGNFAFLGVRDYKIVGGLEKGDLVQVEGSGRGLLRDPKMRVLRRANEMVVMTPEVREFLRQPVPLIVVKANVRSRVHRRVHMDYIGIKRFDKDGNVVGERRVVGLFTAAAYNRSPRYIPLLRRKIELVLEMAHLPPGAHDMRSLANVLETYPRDELFQVTVDELLDTSIEILRLQKRPHTKIFIRYDRFDRFASVLAYVPRDKYDTDLRIKIGELLRKAMDGRVSAFTPTFLQGAMTRVHYIIGRDAHATHKVDIPALEAAAEELMRDWQDDLEALLLTRYGNSVGQQIAKRYGHGFSASYREHFPLDRAVSDVEIIENLRSFPELALRSYRKIGDPESALRLTIYHWDAPLTLSDTLVVLENMGLKVIEEIPHTLEVGEAAGTTAAGEPASGRTVWMHDFYAAHRQSLHFNLDAVKDTFEETFRAAWFGNAENDRFNRLALEQGLQWREVVILRALSRYLKQTGSTYSDAYVVGILSEYSEISRMLIALFEWRFNPDIDIAPDERRARQKEILGQINAALDNVHSLDADRIIQQYVTLLTAALRTNFYQRQRDGNHKSYLSIKFDSKKIPFLPQPRPMFEIYVYSPRLEGVHLRGGKVARGGLRWSDRPEDFRSEVLGLVKAQMVKNSVIVPTGAKGGFVPKNLPGAGASRDEVLEEAIACYKIFISALLDITDNLSDDGPVAPFRVISYDEPDPYLVVAADKGTATFSDIANEMAQSYGFWLGDAFASGGKAGYDHKKMGITARGAWEAVKRHFCELGTDIQSTPFTVTGVGDMSGDVFGNGMLLSRQIRLIAAFDHRDIFLDPDPDPETSFRERERLFTTPRTSWQDYDKKLISAGGGVFSRAAKSITVTPEVAKALGIAAGPAAPQDIMQAILRAPVDLLWFGGIGTYIKAREETHQDVSDRVNDPIRVNAHEVRAKVIGEGANLGITQRGRVAFSHRGGRINTDFIDNAGGVDSSDHEVNIKIALDSAVKAGTITLAKRNQILEAMTEEVASLVLRSNYDQTLALSLAEAFAPSDLDAHGRFIRIVEKTDPLFRQVEILPDEETLRELKEREAGLTRPELAVLLAYAKTTLYDRLVASDVPDADYLDADLIAYFPRPMREPFRDVIQNHRLRREIVANILANDIVNTGGLTFVTRIWESMGVTPPEVARAYIISRDVFRIHDLRGRINALDFQIDAASQHAAHEKLRLFLRDQAIWFLRYRPCDLDLERAIDQYRVDVGRLASNMEKVLQSFEANALAARIETGRAMGFGDDLAHDLAILDNLIPATDIIDVARDCAWPLEETAKAYFAIGAALDLDRLRADAYNLVSGEHWERLAVRRSIEDLYRQQRVLATVAISQNGISGTGEQSGQDVADIWLQNNDREVGRVTTLISEMNATGPLTGAKLALAGSQIRDLISGYGGRHLQGESASAAL